MCVWYEGMDNREKEGDGHDGRDKTQSDAGGKEEKRERAERELEWMTDEA